MLLFLVLVLASVPFIFPHIQREWYWSICGIATFAGILVGLGIVLLSRRNPQRLVVYMHTTWKRFVVAVIVLALAYLFGWIFDSFTTVLAFFLLLYISSDVAMTLFIWQQADPPQRP